jgi:UDP-sulfoquinovose synthase
MHLANKGFEVVGVDDFSRRKMVAEVGSHSATPIKSMEERLRAFEQTFGKRIDFIYGDLTDYGFVHYVLDKFRPDAIVHLAELSSAPYSMIDVDHAVLTQTNNIVGTLNLLYAMRTLVSECHLVKMGSMGEYGMPNIDIPEGFFEVDYRGRKDRLLFPRHSFSDWYHWSKVHDSGNVMLACEIWDLRATDIMQGVVYGTRSEEIVNDSLLTRFDFDAVFGTVINRFCAQAVVGQTLTVYGKGGQRRPVISLKDAMQCLRLAVENPPEKGEYKVFNQFDESYSVGELAEKVKGVGNKMGLGVETLSMENPRVEDEAVCYYNPVHEKLYKLGFRPKHGFEEELDLMLDDLVKQRARIVEKRERILPNVHWRE